MDELKYAFTRKKARALKQIDNNKRIFVRQKIMPVTMITRDKLYYNYDEHASPTFLYNPIFEQ